MSDLIDRQAVINTEGLDEQIRCEMCRNPMRTDRGCDGNCKYDERLYERIMQILGERINPLSSVQPYTDEEIQKIQELEQAQLDKAFKLGKKSAKAEIIHCGECKHWREGTAFSYCDKLHGMGVLDALDYMTAEDDYCSMAERRTNETD